MVVKVLDLNRNIVAEAKDGNSVSKVIVEGGGQ